MRRRQFITLLVGAAVAWPLWASGQQPELAMIAVTMDPAKWVFEFSPNMPRHPTARPNGGWYFDFPQRDGVHHLNFVGNGASIANAARIRAELRVEALEGTIFKESDPCNDHAASVRLFFQRSGDKFTADGGRWWSNPIRYRLVNGSAVLDVPLTGDQWSGVFGKLGSEQPTQFNSSKRSLRAVGFSFGGCFFAHGVYVSGGFARFSATSFTVQ